MEAVAGLLHQGFSFVVPFVVLLGVLIFVHEFGHFAVAKFFGVRVEVFSLGFGRKILQKKKGDTVYCVSAIPLGGYVKMYGDDPSQSIPANQRKYSFTHKPVLPRIAIVLAGPFMNALFALFLFIVIAAVGEESVKPVLGDIFQNTAAYTDGFRTGDTIVAVDGAPIEKWEQLKKSIEASSDKKITMTVLRADKTLQIQATPQSAANKNVLSTQATVGEIDGFTTMSRASSIGISNPLSSAYRLGLRTGDIIRKVGETEVTRWTELEHAFADAKKAGKPSVKLVVDRTVGAKSKLDIDVNLLKDFSGIEPSDLFLAQVMPKSAAEEAGIRAGDKLVSIQGAKLNRWEDVVNKVQSYKEGQAPLKIELVRDGKTITATVAPRITTQTDIAGAEKKTYALGVVTNLVFAQPETFVAREKGIGATLARGFSETVNWTKLTVLSFVKLVQREVSAKNIGGVLMIGKLAGDTWRIGISPFLKIMAIISINLFVLNLLPIPVLDGGHLLFFFIELIKGSPLSFKKLEIMQQVGMALLLLLMAFSLYNDIVRLFSS